MPRAVSFAALVALGALALTSSANGDTLTRSESTRLDRGETVVREHAWEASTARYVGGVTYTVLDAIPEEIFALFDDLDAYRRVLPHTKSARFASVEPSGDKLVELVSGTALVEAEYTLRVRETPGGREIRFWLEPSRPHEIDDAWGFFRIEPFVGSQGQPRVLLTYAILVDVGPGMLRELFEGKVRSALLSVPQRVRRYVAEVRESSSGRN